MTAPVYIAPLAGVSAGMALVLDGDEGHHAAMQKASLPLKYCRWC